MLDVMAIHTVLSFSLLDNSNIRFPVQGTCMISRLLIIQVQDLRDMTLEVISVYFKNRFVYYIKGGYDV